MKITFYSNFLNHHQLPFCRAMQALTDNNFTFVAAEGIPEDRVKLGYEDMNKKYDFVLTTYDSEENKEKAMKLAEESDAIIHGSAPEAYITRRLKLNKLTFRYSERIYKRGIWRVVSPRGFKHMMRYHRNYRKEKLHMLCASAYTAGDFAMLGSYKNKCYKWGYFPEVIEYDIEDLISKKSQEKVELLWVGRFIDWKHPEMAIEIADKLRNAGYDFQLNMVGTGELIDTMKALVTSKKLDDYVKILGSMGYEKVREYMEKSNIFLFTSDYNEGWGAVLNESMNSGCAIVASHAIGATPFLLKNGKNGLIYKGTDLEDMYQKTLTYMNDKELSEKVGIAAYNTLKDTWNAQKAAEGFIHLVKQLTEESSEQGKHGKPSEESVGSQCIEEGPCSVAEPIMQWKMYGKTQE